MKSSILKLIALSSLVVFASSEAEFTEDPKGDSTLPEKAEQRDLRGNQAAIRRMEARKMEILSRVGVSAPLDATETTDPMTGVDSVQELYESGFIIPATLEDVEAALHAASQTPETEDDTSALILMHRGSYRFFISE